ncbi:MAG: phosphoadenylyl-sulfate reductase [Armatimonadetes bacterium]|nr:phosphoadenylyl-sulfate reductase [Armatimonadota bacterium]
MEPNKRVTNTDIHDLNQRFEGLRAYEIVQWSVREFGSRVALASSFGAEDMVLLDMLARADARARVFLLDTGRLHQETYDLVDTARARYGIGIEVYFPERGSVERLMMEKGPNSFYRSVEDRKECCRIRKVEPLARALSSVDAWITGLRRSQSVTRADVGVVETDEAHGGILKINPLASWSEEDVWSYVRDNNVPHHPLHDRGFPSIGCAPCTRAIEPGEDVRAGRWWWENPEHKECGLHTKG